MPKLLCHFLQHSGLQNRRFSLKLRNRFPQVGHILFIVITIYTCVYVYVSVFMHPCVQRNFCAFSPQVNYRKCLRVYLCVCFVHLYNAAKNFCALTCGLIRLGYLTRWRGNFSGRLARGVYFSCGVFKSAAKRRA